MPLALSNKDQLDLYWIADLDCWLGSVCAWCRGRESIPDQARDDRAREYPARFQDMSPDAVLAHANK